MDNTLSIRVASLTLLPVPFKVIYNIYTIHFALFTRLFLATKSQTIYDVFKRISFKGIIS